SCTLHFLSRYTLPHSSTPPSSHAPLRPSLPDALPISSGAVCWATSTATRDEWRPSPARSRSRAFTQQGFRPARCWAHTQGILRQDRKSTRLNSSHVSISYAVFCLQIHIDKS